MSEQPQDQAPQFDFNDLVAMATQASALVAAEAGVYRLVMLMVDQMAPIAWQKMGLQPNPLTGRTEKNLAEAKVAVDVTAFLASQLESQLDETDRRQIQNLVRDLRINYVEKANEAKA